MEEVFLNFYRFQPPQEVQSKVVQRILELHEEAPSGATLRATFTRQDEEFRGAITILSAAGRFFATARGDYIQEVSRKLMFQIRRQLAKWKNVRFELSVWKDFSEEATAEKPARPSDLSIDSDSLA